MALPKRQPAPEAPPPKDNRVTMTCTADCRVAGVHYLPGDTIRTETPAEFTETGCFE